MPADFSHILAQNVHDLKYLLPEMLVVATFLLALIFDLAVEPARRKSTGYICIVGLLIAAWLVFKHLAQETSGPAQREIFSGMLAYDHFGSFIKLLVLLGTIVSLMLALHARELFGQHHGEFFLLMVAVCAGGMFLASASNLLMIYLSIEALSLGSYALAGCIRNDRKSAEAGMKYVIYGALSSGLMIFGMSYLYGLAGSLRLDEIALKLFSAGHAATQAPRAALAAVLALVFSGFLYKIAAVPFHYWSPDVYEGAPTAATSFFSVVPKAAGFAVLIRVLFKVFPASSPTWLAYPHAEKVVAVLAVLTMTFGNLAALGQTNAKRLLAYSSIAQAGYMLAGLSALDNGEGAAAVMYYLVAYLFMNLGAFLVVLALENILGGSDLKQLRGAVRREPFLAVTLCIFLFSLTGVPPFAGFAAKYLIMLKLAERGSWLLIFWIGINSVISLYYYMKLAKAVAIDKPETEAAATVKVPLAYNTLAFCKSAALLLLFIYFEPIQRWCVMLLAPLR